MAQSRMKISIGFDTLVRIVLVGFLTLAFIKLSQLMLIVLTSVVIAAAIEPATHWFAKHKVSRLPAVLFVYVASFLLLAFALYGVVPLLVNEVGNLASVLPKKVQWLAPINNGATALSSLSGSFDGEFDLGKFTNALIRLPVSGNILETLSLIFGGISSFVFIVVISFYLAVQDRGVENFLRIISPIHVETYLIGLWKRTEQKIGRWMQGQLLLALIIGPLVYLGLTILQIKYAFSLALLAATFELIPFFGPILSAVPAVLIGFGISIPKGLMVIAFYVIIQQFENHLIYPLVVKKVIGIPPIIVILALLAGGQLAGFLGLLLAVPVAVLLMELLADFEKNKQLKVSQIAADNE